ncbi:MAG TPA: hypothetical protein VFY68_14415 [Nitrososphaeraceae archaeon]|nr:hypothetical protein [Nitrososphaeraceae archaeon]
MRNRERSPKMEDDTHLHEVCKRIIELDDKIRFAGIPNKFGKQIVVEYRKGLDPLLTDNESELYAIETVIRMNTRKDFELKLGKPVYSFTLYEKLKRVTIPLDNKDYPILMVSFDIDANHESIILENIIPYIKKELA